MKKKIRKIFKSTLLALLIFVTVLATIILFPQLLFANIMKYRNFKVCSNHKISNDIKVILDNAINIVQSSDLYDSNYKYNIILCHNSFYNKIESTILGRGPSARATFNNVVVKVKIELDSNLAFATFPKECEINLTYLLAHEMIHCLQARKYGILKFNPFRHPELWKVEGYSEYISRRSQLSNSGYSLTKEIERYVDLQSKASDMWIAVQEGGCEFPNYYYKGRLMIEYLIDIKHLRYDQILKDTTSENNIFKEMLNWKDSIKRSYIH